MSFVVLIATEEKLRQKEISGRTEKPVRCKMQRNQREKHLIQKRKALLKQMYLGLDAVPEEYADGRFRKTLKGAGCGKARCQVCHPEKYPKRIPTRKEKQVDAYTPND